MFGQTGYAAARARYRDLDLSSKVEGASPHRLIGILYEELLKTLDTMAAGLAAGGDATKMGMPVRRARAMSILLGLEGSLDHDNGGGLSQGLAAVYRETRRLIGEAITNSDPAPLAQAREIVSEISDAWTQIG